MAKRNEIERVVAPAGVIVGPNSLGERPAHLQRQAGVRAEGTDELKQFVVVPRSKVVQKSAGEGVRAMGFGTGDIMLSPTGVELMRIGRDRNGNPDPKGPPIYVTPLFFFADWATWNPIDTKGTDPAIAFRTNDARHPIVAKSRDKNLRLEPLLGPDGRQREVAGKKLFQRHVEHLNFICYAHGHEVRDPFIVSFAKGEHFTGMKWSGLIRMRDADIFGCIFQLNAQLRPPRAGNDWYGIEPSNPDADAPHSGWVTDTDMYEQFRVLHAGFKETFKTVGIRADMTDADDLQDGDQEVVGDGQRTM